MEHGRIIEIIRTDANKSSASEPLIVADLMAGVGPFAIPLAKVDANKSTKEPPKKKSKIGNEGTAGTAEGPKLIVYANGNVLQIIK